MWGASLSGPLPIVATVGRRPTVKLIGRIPIPYRRKALGRALMPSRDNIGY